MATNTPLILYAGNNDNLLHVSELANNQDNTIIAAGTVTATIKDTDGVNVAGETWPLSLSPDVTPGNYLATLQSSIALIADNDYIILINADNGAGLVGEWEIMATAKLRTD